MDKTLRISRTLRGSLLITGTSIGAGMLGIPMVTAGAGFGFAALLSVLVWAFMALTGLLLLEAALSLKDGANFISISRKYLGRWGSYVTAFLFIFLYFFLMIAYIAGGGPLLGGILLGSFGISLSYTTLLCIFVTIFAAIVAIGPKSIDYVNLFLSILMGFLFVGLFAVQAPSIDASRLVEINLPKGLFALPVLFSAFGFHNIIPSLVTYMKRDVWALRSSILVGTAIPLVVYLAWQWLIIGSVPPSVMQEVSQGSQSILAYLAAITNQPIVLALGLGFAFTAITTSVLGVAFSLVDFLSDGLRVWAKGVNRLALVAITFIPPLIGAIVKPEIFAQALGVAGGVGEALINGLVPIAIVYAMAKRKIPLTIEGIGKNRLLVVLSAFALIVMGVEVLNVWM